MFASFSKFWDFINCVVLGIACCFFVPLAVAKNISGDGHLRLYNYHLDQFIEVRYLRSSGEWDGAVHEQLNQFLRSRKDDATHPIDRRLIEWVDHLQDHFGVDTIEVISAFRSPPFNEELRQSGRKTAKNSLHTRGQALDIHIDEIRESVLRDYLLSLKLGGVGYYGKNLMVHIDVGPVRGWTLGEFVENTGIGIFHDKNPLKIRTDRLFYELKDSVKITFSQGKPPKHLALQKFHRGQWRTVVPQYTAVQKPFKPAALLKGLQDLSPYGKFRFHAESAKGWQHSNEFYIKKQ